MSSTVCQSLKNIVPFLLYVGVMALSIALTVGAVHSRETNCAPELSNCTIVSLQESLKFRTAYCTAHVCYGNLTGVFALPLGCDNKHVGDLINYTICWSHGVHVIEQPSNVNFERKSYIAFATFMWALVFLGPVVLCIRCTRKEYKTLQ